VRRRPRAGEILGHNHITHTMPHGVNGFRWFSALPGPQWAQCPCGWRPDPGIHYAHTDFMKHLRELKETLGGQESVD